jgi:ABC-type multidrug transport system ATPase subunit
MPYPFFIAAIMFVPVSGYAKPGTLLAVLGASGAGKTSLLNALGGKTPTDCQLGGQVILNGRLCKPKEMKYYSGFVHQVDMFYTCLTVKEHLLFVVSRTRKCLCSRHK